MGDGRDFFSEKLDFLSIHSTAQLFRSMHNFDVKQFHQNLPHYSLSTFFQYQNKIDNHQIVCITFLLSNLSVRSKLLALGRNGFYQSIFLFINDCLCLPIHFIYVVFYSFCCLYTRIGICLVGENRFQRAEKQF